MDSFVRVEGKGLEWEKSGMHGKWLIRSIMGQKADLNDAMGL